MNHRDCLPALTARGVPPSRAEASPASSRSLALAKLLLGLGGLEASMLTRAEPNWFMLVFSVHGPRTVGSWPVRA